MAKVVFEDIQKVYPDGTQAIFDLNLEIADEEFVILVGPSGCGKSAALRMVAGVIGSPSMNISEATLRKADGRIHPEMLVHFHTESPPIVSEDMKAAIDDAEAFEEVERQAKSGGSGVHGPVRAGQPAPGR